MGSVAKGVVALALQGCGLHCHSPRERDDHNTISVSWCRAWRSPARDASRPANVMNSLEEGTLTPQEDVTLCGVFKTHTKQAVHCHQHHDLHIITFESRDKSNIVLRYIASRNVLTS